MKNKIIGNIKLYPKNTKKKIMTLFLIGTIISISLPGCSKDKTCNIKEDHYHIYKNKNDIEYTYKDCNFNSKSYTNTGDYIIKDDLGNYLYQNNLYETELVKDEIEEELNKQRTIYQIKSTTPYKNKNGKLTFPTKWKTVSKKTFSNYEGIGRTGTEIEYKTYKISKENNIYKKEKVTSKDLEQGTYIDINDFVILQDAEQSYYVKGKKL